MLLSGSFPHPPQPAEIPSVKPPVAAKKARARTSSGDRSVDHYRWLREKDDPAVVDCLTAENVYTEAVMRSLEDFRARVYKEMLSRIQETDESVPYRRRGYWYYQREVQGQQYPISCRRKGTMEAPEEVLLDVNEVAKGHKFTSIGILEVSPDSTKLAYSVDLNGFRQYVLHVKDLSSGQALRDTVERVTSVAWAADNKTLFYVEEHPTTKRCYLFFSSRRRHTRLVSDWSSDVCSSD